MPNIIHLIFLRMENIFSLCLPELYRIMHLLMKKLRIKSYNNFRADHKTETPIFIGWMHYL